MPYAMQHVNLHVFGHSREISFDLDPEREGGKRRGGVGTERWGLSNRREFRIHRLISNSELLLRVSRVSQWT